MTLKYGGMRGWLVTGLIVAGLGCAEKAPEKKIGYVDNGVILTEFDLAVKARNELQAATQQMQIDITKLETELKTLQERFVNQGRGLPVAQQIQLRDQVAAKEQEYIQFVQQANQRASQLEAEKMQPVLDALNKHVEAYGKQNGYYMILGTTGNGNIVYADSTANITTPVMEYMRQQR
ncbi:MAG: OmpH family outer membrane protein [candidate division Zixibacteria bacterium]|nr:OmpH family outer membrane protein [candidate division Zixibacteria bacterium]